MKNLLLILFLGGILIMNACKPKEKSVFSIIPRPLEAKKEAGKFIIDNNTVIKIDKNNAEIKKIAEYFNDRFNTVSGRLLSIKEDIPQGSKAIIITKKGADPKLGKEGYELLVHDDMIELRAEGEAGLFWAVQTLFQLMPEQIYGNKKSDVKEWIIPGAYIKDEPRFKWRGMHLDVGRHMFPVEFIKKYIDYLAMHKFNTFHWHLTEDQGWRIEIKKYPKLTTIGAYRDSTLIGHSGRSNKYDGKRYGGFYTQDEVREIVKYAADRYITVVPEIEMPGHSVAALTAYPELSCTGGPFHVRTTWGISKDIYCAGNDSVFTFLENVLTEVMELFPSKVIHIGGDEAPKERWEKCSKCQKRIKDEGLKDEHGLQSYFITRIEKFLNSKGRHIIGWDEILEGGLAPNAAVMSWRGIEGGIAAARQNHDVVMTPTDYCYFDYYQEDPQSEPLAIGGLLSTEKVYSYEPLPHELDEEQAKHILGAQGNVWTEYIYTPEDVEYMTLPRMTALSEVVWTKKDLKDFDDFSERLGKQYLRLDQIGCNYFISGLKGVDSKNVFIDKKKVHLKGNFPGSEIYYTLDGSEPDVNSALYSAPFEIDRQVTLKAKEFFNGKSVGKTFTAEFTKETPLKSVQVEDVKNGLSFQYFLLKEGIDSTVQLMNFKANSSGTLDAFKFPSKKMPEYFGMIYEGFIKIPETGVYTISIISNDGTKLYLGDKLLVNNDGMHGPEMRRGQIALEEGFFPVKLYYFQAGGGSKLEVRWSGPGINNEIIDGKYLYTIQ
jgi:hexosaminidase